MKRGSFIWVIVLFFSSELPAKTDVTIYCDDNYPPYSYVEDGEVRGIYTEVLKLAFSRMKDYNITIHPRPWKRGLRLIEKGLGFALYPPYYRPEMRPWMGYSVPILEERLTVFVRKSVADERKTLEWPRDFYGLKIGKNQGYAISQDKEFLEAVAVGRIKIDEAQNNRANLLKLGLGRLDAYINDRVAVLWELGRLAKAGVYDVGGRYEKIVEGPILSVEFGHLGFTTMDQGVFGFKEDFVAKFNSIITDMKRDGEIDRIVNRMLHQSYMPFGSLRHNWDVD